MRQSALKTLGHIAEPTDPAVLAAIVPCLTDGSASVRESAITALMSLALRAKEALGAFPKAVLDGLLDCLQDPDGRVRDASANSIIKVAIPGDAKVVGAVAERMCHADGEVRRAASSTLVALAIKFGEVDNPGVRAKDPDASPLDHIKRLMLHPSLQVQPLATRSSGIAAGSENVLLGVLQQVLTPAGRLAPRQVQRAAIEGMETISSARNSLYNAVHSPPSTLACSCVSICTESRRSGGPCATQVAGVFCE